MSTHSNGTQPVEAVDPRLRWEELMANAPTREAEFTTLSGDELKST